MLRRWECSRPESETLPRRILNQPIGIALAILAWLD